MVHILIYQQQSELRVYPSEIIDDKTSAVGSDLVCRIAESCGFVLGIVY